MYNASDALTNGLVHFTFNTVDYIVCFLMLAVSTGIGVYFGFFDNSENTTVEYLLGGKRMKTVPIALSFIASQMSGVAIISIPSELYNFGIDWAFCIVCMVIVIPIIYWVIVPILYSNNFSNSFDYLEERFNRRTRLTITWSFIMLVITLLPVYIFIPSLAFSQVTNINIHVINTIICSVCVFYTLFGGIKAVIWTDVLQVCIMICAVVLFCILGTIKVGGLGEVFRIASAGHRLTTNFSFDVSSRNTFWNVFATTTVLWIAQAGLNQSVVQRMLSLPKMRDAQNAILYYGIGFTIIMLFLCLTGVAMYARFYDCDPVMAGVVAKHDQLMIYFVQDIVGDLIGMPGVFIAAVFSASLSTVSAALNALSGIIYFDFIKPYIKHTEARGALIMKVCVFILGVYCILGGFMAENFKSMLQMSQMIGGIFCGTIAGTFLLGMLFPRAHGQAIFIAALVSMLSILILSIGTPDNFYDQKLPVSTEGCSNGNSSLLDIMNETKIFETEIELKTNVWWIFDISFNWYMPLGFAIVCIVCIPLSFILKPDKHHKINPKLLSPLVHSFNKYKLANTDELDRIQTDNTI